MTADRLTPAEREHLREKVDAAVRKEAARLAGQEAADRKRELQASQRLHPPSPEIDALLDPDFTVTDFFGALDKASQVGGQA